MKLKLLLFFLVVLGFSAIVKAQTTKPYTNLVITEALYTSTPDNYVEFTNMGSETINLGNFEFGHITAWNTPWNPEANNYFRLPKNKTLAPGESYVIATAYLFGPKMWKKDPLHYQERITKPEMFKLADQLLYARENNMTAADTLTPYYSTMDDWNGRGTWYLRHHFLNEETGEKDSVVIDQVGGVFNEDDGSNADGPYDVAGVTDATSSSVLIRKASVKTGNVNFAEGRGLDAADSEWIPVKYLSIYQWRAVFWTVGNQAVGAKLDNNTLVSKSGKEVVDIVNGTITVPWGVRRKDSIMYRFERRPGLAWAYDVVANREDSAFVSSRTGDKLTLYVCGDEPTVKEFMITVQDPTPSDNIVIPKCGMNFANMAWDGNSGAYGGWQVTDKVPVMDTISRVGYATRIDTLFKYLEKPTKATWKIKFVDNHERPDLKYGDILQVTSENGKLKEYFLKLAKFVPSDDAYLGSITWPDMPSYFKGAVAKSYGWAGDTIPGFDYSNNGYIVKVPLDYNGIPALVFTKRDLNSKVTVNRAKTLSGTVEDRTVTFTVTAENDTTVNVYTVRFDKEKDDSNVQPWVGEPFFTQIVFHDDWGKMWVEVVNPGTKILDLSNYMIFASGASGVAAAFAENNTAETTYANAYMKYVPGKKWQDEASWTVQPRILEPDFAVNPMVYPGDVFVMTEHPGGGSFPTYGKEADVNFANGMNPWGYTMQWGNAIHTWLNFNMYLYKITGDSVANGLKPTTDINDFELVDMFGKADGTNLVVGGREISQIMAWTRKPNLYKGNPEVGASLGTNWDNSEWIMRNDQYYYALGYGWPIAMYNIVGGIGAHVMDEVTMYRSTVSSKVLKVSEGYSMDETIKGVKTGTTVTGLYADLLKAHEDQALKVKSVATGAFLTDASLLSNGDMLVVLSADSTNTSQYTLNVSEGGLSSNAVLTPASAKYTVDVTGTTGTVGGFNVGALLKDVYAGVNIPAGATLTITDANDAYMSLLKLNFDTAYSNVIATDKIYFEVIAENGINKILYQLTPTVNPSEAKITSDVYSVDQFASLVQYVPAGTTATTMKNNVYPSTGATLVIYDKEGNVRTTGDIYRDDKLVVTSSDGNTVKTYYFAMLNASGINPYLAYVISEDYEVNQLEMRISGDETLSVNEFVNKLYPSFGATLSVIDKDGNTNTTGTFKKGDKLLVTAADGLTTATYNISMITKANDITAETIKMYPNPTDGRVIVQGLAKGNRVREINASGVTLRDVIADNSTDYVSLAAQPAGIYVFIISNGDKFISIQKIVKK
ncbi:MAG: T9SS type A sorting domain-containing protein [Prolixibacteraceae bacterium]|nr:T9SS type A sorting domain-containing protein [Prolixibacteraceae bacterium]